MTRYISPAGGVSNIPDVTVGRREIPAGKVLLADPLRDRAVLDREPRAERIVLGAGKIMSGRYHVCLCAWTPGWTCAGSMMRWDNGSYGYQYQIDGAFHGRRFLTFEEAADAFAKLIEDYP